ncbi:hypothetical protein Tco_0128028 [Tanacetum coccineum]
MDHFSSDDSSSDSPSGSSSGYSSDTSSGHSIPDSPFDTSAAIFVGPSRKRCMVLSYLIPIATLVSGALSPIRTDLLPPHYATLASSSSAGPSQKRSRRGIGGTSAMHSDKSGDEGSPKTHTESDMDSDIRADIKAETVAAATTAAVTVDGLDIEPVMTGVEMGFEPGLAVVESESEPDEAEAYAEVQP